MPIVSQTLKGHNSETVHLFELKFLEEMYFDQLYLRCTREVLGIDALSMAALDFGCVKGPYFSRGQLLKGLAPQGQ
jgi:hypothetical protein